MSAAAPLDQRVDAVAFGAVVLVTSGAVLPPFLALEPDVDPITGNPAYRVLLTVIYVGVAALTLRASFRHPRAALRCCWNASVMWLLVLWSLLSYFWSEAPDLTLRRAIALLLTSACGFHAALSLPLERVFLVTWKTLLAAIALSVLAALVWPIWGIQPDASGAWRGIFAGKNALGLHAGICTTLSVVGIISYTRFRRVVFVLATVLGVTALIASSCVSALLVVSGTLALFPLVSWYRRAPSIAILLVTPLSVALFLALAVHVDDLPLLLASLGRDPTLTGRTALWDALLLSLANRPILGYGYGAFWLGSDWNPSEVWFMAGWQASQAHNGYLDVALETGLVGLVLLAITIFFALRRTLSLSRSTPHFVASVPLLLLLQLLASNVTETLAVRPTSLVQVILVFVAAVHAPFSPTPVPNERDKHI